MPRMGLPANPHLKWGSVTWTKKYREYLEKAAEKETHIAYGDNMNDEKSNVKKTKQEMKKVAKKTIEIIRRVQEERPNNVITIYFCEKKTDNKYRSFKPQISNELQEKVIDLIADPLLKTLELPVTQYNPIGVLDEENELIKPEQVSCVKNFMDSISDETLVTEMGLIKVQKISFYCVEISFQEKRLFLFRQFTKMSRLRKGLLSQIVNEELKELEGDFLGIDDLIDMVLSEEALIIINHISLERVFNYRDKFLDMTNQAIGRIVMEGKMANVEQFSKDCLNDVRIMKRFTNLMSKDRLPLFFDNYERVPEIVKTLGLDIDFDEEGKMIYRDKSQLFHIVHLMSDSYFKSLLAARIGVVEMEGSI